MLKNKKFIFTTGLIFILLLIALPFFTSRKRTSSTSAWVCRDGQWVKQGNPKTSMPQTDCSTKSSSIFSGLSKKQNKDSNGSNNSANNLQGIAQACDAAKGSTWCQVLNKCIKLSEEQCDFPRDTAIPEVEKYFIEVLKKPADSFKLIVTANNGASAMGTFTTELEKEPKKWFAHRGMTGWFVDSFGNVPACSAMVAYNYPKEWAPECSSL